MAMRDMDMHIFGPSPFMSKMPQGTGAPPSFPDSEGKADEPASASKDGASGKDSLFASVARKIKAIRKERDLSLTDLARMADCSISVIFSAESGHRNITLTTVEKIAEALEMDPRELFPGQSLVQTGDESVAMLKLVDAALETSLTEMGRTTIMLQQVRKLIVDMQRQQAAGGGTKKR